MPATPSITLTATLQDVAGSAIGSAANPSKLCIALCGFGALLPRIAGTSLIGRVGPVYLESTSGTFTTFLWGNDVINPSGTYYTISLLDGQGNVVQCAAYQLTGSGTVDLSSLSPIITPAQGSPGITAVFASAPTIQQCSGALDTVNKNFTFSAPASPTPLIAVHAAGIFLTPTNDYSAPTFQGGTTWQVILTSAPQAGPVTVLIFAQANAGSRTVTVAPTVIVAGATADNTLFCNFSASTSFAIPNASTAGLSYELTFIDVSYAAITNNITITCAGGINNGTSFVINSNGGAVTLRSDGSIWRVKSKV